MMLNISRIKVVKSSKRLTSRYTRIAVESPIAFRSAIFWIFVATFSGSLSIKIFAMIINWCTVLYINTYMLVSMIHYNTIQGKKNRTEVVIADSVRTLIVTVLRDGKEKRFSQITRALERKDNVVNRELKNLIDRGWVIKTNGYYKLDLKNEDVVNYIKHSDVAIPLDSEIKEIKSEFCYDKLPHFREVIGRDYEREEEILSGLPEDKKEFLMNLIDEPYRFEYKHRELMKTVTAELFTKIQIHAILDKNFSIMPQMSDLDYEDLVFLMNSLIENQASRIYRIESEKDPKTSIEKYNEIKKQVSDKPFKLIISYNPKKD